MSSLKSFNYQNVMVIFIFSEQPQLNARFMRSSNDLMVTKTVGQPSPNHSRLVQVSQIVKIT